MEFIDIIISAYSYVADILYGTKTYDDVITLRNIVPLYDLNEKIIAYYVTFLLNNNVLPNCPSNGNTLKSEWFNGFGGLLGSKIFENHKYCYVVVNNNVENPAAIEFGSGLNEIIENKLLYDSKSKLIYNNPLSIYGGKDIKLLSDHEISKLKDIHFYFPELTLKNHKLAAFHQNIKKTFARRFNGNYPFLTSDVIPAADYTSYTIKGAVSVDWAIMNDYSISASDHCAATAITNLALYFAEAGYSDLKVNNCKDDTFKVIHNITGNGPVMFTAGKAEKYFSSRGYRLVHNNISTIKAAKTTMSKDRPCALMLIGSVFSWHWVIGVGWRQYTAGNDFYIQINDSWNNTINKYYRPGAGAVWWSATSYYVKGHK